MNILQVNTLATRGGAALACLRLHRALNAAGHHSRIVSGQRTEGKSDMRTWMPPGRLRRALNFFAMGLEIKLGLEGLLNAPSRLGWRQNARWADVINLHNLHSYHFAFPLLPRLEAEAPLVWSLHDMWALTGHCAYPMQCRRWRRGCGACPNLLGPPRIDLDTTALLYRIKKWVFGRINPTLVTPSRWLARLAKQAPLTRRFRTECIPNGVDLGVFRPLPAEASRRALGLPADANILLAPANSMTRLRKGKGLLSAGLRRLRAEGVRDVRLVLVGACDQDLAGRVPYPITLVGPVESESLMAALYSAADIYALPTRADNLPNTLLESIACGTPCVACSVGGVPEVIRPGRTGWLAEPENPEDLARCLHRALAHNRERDKIARTCRAVAEQDYSVSLMRKRYVSLYEQLVQQRENARRRESL